MTTDLVLTTQPYDPIALIEGAARLGPATKIKYVGVMREYLAGGGDLGNAGQLAVFARGLSNSRRSHLRAAVKRWAGEMTKQVKGAVTPETVDAAHATIMRFEALADAIEVQTPKGEKPHTWLSRSEVKRLYNLVGNGITGARDVAVLGLLVAAGLRREEAVNLTFEDITTQPLGERVRTVLAVKGKGAKNRVVPISDTLAGHLRAWGDYVGHTGLVCRSIGVHREPGESMSAVAVFKMVRKYGARLGRPELAPHDLRRTYAQLGYEAGVPLTQLSKLLGHADLGTTQRYLNLDLDLAVTASDHVPWG